MAEQTAKEYRAVQREHLVREMETHKGGIKYAEGQVQEIKELIEQIDNACLYCGRAIRNWRDETPSQMDSHIMDRHPEDWAAMEQECLEIAQKVVEAHNYKDVHIAS